MIPLALVVILGAIQLTLVFNAHSMMKLAAFNAARAAIVAHGAKPEDPATVDEGLSQATTSAKLSLIPVIPALHGFTPSAGGLQSLIQNGLLNGLSASNITGSPALHAAYELSGGPGAIKVEFLNRNDHIDAKAVTNWPNRIDFDDPTPPRPDENIIKVRVSWDYPLAIPYINRIMTAIARPDLYRAYKIINAAGQPLTPDNLLNVAQQLALNNKPAWDYADFMTRSTGSAAADGLLSYMILRWPMRATAVMRAQWDRKPK
jgi:hypothetical protein